MKLRVYPDAILTQICQPVNDKVDNKLQEERIRLVSKMFKVMRKKRGCGLSAPQVGFNIRMFVWLDQGCVQAIWNPELRGVTGSSLSQEGCLSFPGIHVTIERSTSAVLRGTGINGRPVQFVGNQLTTRIWQHEIDHLNGISIIHHMNDEEAALNQDAIDMLLKHSTASKD